MSQQQQQQQPSLTCVWNANGSMSCNKVCSGLICNDAYEYFEQQQQQQQQNRNYTYSINVLVTDPKQTTIYYSRIISNIPSSSAYILDNIVISNLQIQNSPGRLTITDMTSYDNHIVKPPFLQIQVTNSHNVTLPMMFPNTPGLNILMRTASLDLMEVGPTSIAMDRYKMGL